MTNRRMAYIVVGLVLVVIAGQARVAEADDIAVLCSNGLKAVVETLVPKFERETSHHVVVKYGLAALLKQRIEEGEAFDVAFVTPAVIDDLIAHGKISIDTRTTIARSGLALEIRAGAPKPDLSSAEAFKRALLGARSIAYAKEGASGVAFAATWNSACSRSVKSCRSRAPKSAGSSRLMCRAISSWWAASTPHRDGPAPPGS